MSVISEKKLNEILEMIHDGQLREVLDVTEGLLKKNKLTKIEKLQLIALQSQAYIYLNNSPKAIELIDIVEKEFETISDDILKLDALWQKALALNLIGSFNESLAYAEKGIEAIKSVNVKDKMKIYFREAYFNYVISQNLYFFAKFKESYSYAELAYKAALESESPFAEVVYKTWYGLLSALQGKHTEADKLSDEAIVSAQKEEKKLLQAIAYHMTGTTKFVTKKYKKSIELLKKSLEILNDIGTHFMLEGIYNHLGNAYSKFSDFNKSIKYYELALKEDGMFKSGISSNLANTYLTTNNIKKAHELFKLTLSDSIKAGMLLVVPFAYYQLILTSLLLKKNDLAEKYFEELKQLNNKSDNPHIKIRFKQAQILMLKESSNVQDWFEAIKVIEELLSDKSFSEYYRFDALYNLIEIRLKELQLTADKTILADVKKQIDKLQKYAENDNQSYLRTNIYRLKSQLALVELDVEKAIEYLITAKTIAIDRNYKLIVDKIQKDLAKIDEQKRMWLNLQEKKAPLEDALKHIKIDSSARQIADETIVEVRAKGTDEVIYYRKLFALKL